MKHDDLFIEGMKALSTIYLGVIERMQRQIEGLRFMLLEGNVTEDMLEEELGKRVNDPVVQARAKEIVEQDAYTLHDLIKEQCTTAEIIALLKRMREPSN